MERENFATVWGASGLGALHGSLLPPGIGAEELREAGRVLPLSGAERRWGVPRGQEGDHGHS